MHSAQVHNELAGVSPSCGWVLLTLDIQLAIHAVEPGCNGHGAYTWRIISCFLLAHTPHGYTASIKLHHPNQTKTGDGQC
jgi:hypothetical protein